MLVYLARVTWEPGANAATVGTVSHPGPTGLVVESGTLDISDPAAGLSAFNSRLDQGGSIGIRPHRSYRPGGSEFGSTVALMVGVIPAGEPLWLRWQHIGRAHRYRIATDGTWRVQAESWTGSSKDDRASVRLSNFTSEVLVEDFPYGGDPAGCRDEAIARWRGGPGIGNAKPMVVDGAPAEGVDAAGAFAQYVYDRDEDDGTAAPFTAYFECRAFASGEAVLLVTAAIPLADLDAQAEPVQRLLDGIVLLE